MKRKDIWKLQADLQTAIRYLEGIDERIDEIIFEENKRRNARKNRKVE